MRQKRAGFTLIELLIATAIIAILATLVVITTNQNRVKARDVNRKQSLSAISLSLEQQFASNKTYFVQMPGSGTGCNAAGPGEYQPGQDMYMAAVPSSDTSRCVGYKQGGAGLVNAKNSTNPSYAAVNSITDALFQSGLLARIPLDPLVRDFNDIPTTGQDFILTVCTSQGKPAVTPAEATEYGLYARLEESDSLTGDEQDSSSRSCGSSGSLYPFDFSVAARVQ